MPSTSYSPSDQPEVIIHCRELINPQLDFDPTSDRWLLKDGQASVVVGRDIVHPKTFRTWPGRLPVGQIIDGGYPVTDAAGIDFIGFATMRYADFYHIANYYTGTATTLQIRKVNPHTGALSWPTEMIGSRLVVAPDNRPSDDNQPAIATISAITTTTFENDTLEWDSFYMDSGFSWSANDKFEIYYPKHFDRRGIWVTNGRDFWLLHGATFTKYLTISDAPYGTRWSIAKIHPQVLLLTSPSYPPHVIRLNEAEDTIASLGDATTIPNDANWAGCQPPYRNRQTDLETGGSRLASVSDGSKGIGLPTTIDDVAAIRSWRMVPSNTGGYILGFPGLEYRVLVRAVNLVENLYSEFVPVWNNGDLTKDYVLIESGTTNSIKVLSQMDIGPCLSARWTHIEIWRTDATGTYFRERQICIAADLMRQANEAGGVDDGGVNQQLVSGQSEALHVCTLSDRSLSAYCPLLDSETQRQGGLPPICRKAVSLKGVTFCFGKADADATREYIRYAHNRYAWIFTVANYGANSSITRTNHWTGTAWMGPLGYTDLSFVLTDSPTGGLDLGVYGVVAKINDSSLEVERLSGTSATADDQGHLVHAYRHEWPMILSDEVGWYSDPREFAPESFSGDRIELSNIGDRFMDAVVVGNYVVVIMQQGVHLIYRTGLLPPDGNPFAVETIAASGHGTAWADSVVVIGDSVIWATPDGPKVLAVSADPGTIAEGSRIAVGSRGQINWLGPRTMRQWFRDAYDSGYLIDAGVDTLNHTIYWRRRSSSDANYFESLAFNYANNLWTVIEDDSGIRYCQSTYADTNESDSSLLYSVDATGNCFQEYFTGSPHDYDPAAVVCSFDLSDVENAYGTYSATGITVDNFFLPAMAGEIIRFTDPDGYRRILTVGPTGITFASISGLTDETHCEIAARRFRVRFAPTVGTSLMTSKTFRSAVLIAVRGDRNVPIIANLILVPTLYANGEEVASAENIPIEATGEDRVFYGEAEGRYLELEIELTVAKADVVFESLEFEVEETADKNID